TVEDALARAAQDHPDRTHKYAMARSALEGNLDGVDLEGRFRLGSWATFQKMGAQTEVMGDLVLTENEVGPVMQKLSDSGIDITALHNHLTRSTPLVMYMHIDDHGDATHLATVITDALRLTNNP